MSNNTDYLIKNSAAYIAVDAYNVSGVPAVKDMAEDVGAVFISQQVKGMTQDYINKMIPVKDPITQYAIDALYDAASFWGVGKAIGQNPDTQAILKKVIIGKLGVFAWDKIGK